MLTKEQDKIATRLRDAGVPGDIAVLLASRAKNQKPLNAPAWNAVLCGFVWNTQPEGMSFWANFDDAFFDECNARGIK